jgi:two-component system response regulator AtoC
MTTKILIIDDEKSFVRSLMFALEEADVDARCAHSGEDGLDAVRADPPDMVLLDLRLPGANGMEVLVELARITRIYR